MVSTRERLNRRKNLGGERPPQISEENKLSKENPTVVLGLYTGNYTSSTFTPNVLSMALDLESNGVLDKMGFIWEESCRVDSNRNKIIYHFLNDTDADFLFILDEDMIHHPQTPRLLMRYNLPIITGLYFRRNDNGLYSPQIYKYWGQSEDDRKGYGKDINNTYESMVLEVHKFYSELGGGIPAHDGPLVLCNEEGEPLSSGVIRIDGAGFGFVLIRRDVVEKMDPPYLMDELGLNGDLAFYKKAASYGIPIYCDLSIIASHPHRMPIGIKKFSEFTHEIVETAERYREAHENPSRL